MMRILVTGKGGQLASELERSIPSEMEAYFLSVAELDITDATKVSELIQQFKPDVIINAAAYTAVDKAESERDLAMAVNATGPQNLAMACQHVGARLIHVSTDFIFDGTQSHPYGVDDVPNPLGVYGESKWAGDREILKILPHSSVVVRTAWVYSSCGQNFVKTMLRLMKEKESLSVVVDQVGTPTWARGLAEFIWLSIQQNLQGVYHWTDSGVASWYDFAVAIQDLALSKGLLSRETSIFPIPACAYPTPAERPKYGVLDKSKTHAAIGFHAPHWRVQLSKMLDELSANS